MAFISGPFGALGAALERLRGRHMRHVPDLFPEYKRILRLQSSGNEQTGMKASCGLLMII